MRKFLSTIRNSLEKNLILEPKTRLLCAFSGGQDSTFLFFCFLHYQTQFDIDFETTYCHHFLQLKNFFCFWQMIRLNFLFNIPISFLFTLQNLQNENQGRIWRKNSFERIFALQECSKLLLGHTASDKIETSIAKLNRGTSSTGLISLTLSRKHEIFSIFVFFPVHFFTTQTKQQKKINIFLYKKELFQNFHFFWPIRKKVLENNSIEKLRFNNFNLIKLCFIFLIKLNQKKVQKKFNHYFDLFYSLYSFQKKFSFLIIRPILYLHRNDVTKICKIYKLPLISDSTNDLTEVSRNQIRHHLMPFYRYFFSSKIDFFSYRYLDILMLEQKYIESLLEKILETLLAIQKKENLNFPLVNQNIVVSTEICEKKSKIQEIFKTLSTPLQRLCIKKVFFSATNIELNYSQIEFLRLKI